MENRAHAIAAGLFTLLLGAALAVVVMWFGKDDLKLTAYEVTTTQSVAGLKVEAPVRYRGVEVGRVETIRIEPGLSGRIRIRVGVQEDTPITRSTYAQLGYQGVTGLAYVTLNDDGSSSELLKRHGRELPQISLRPSLLDSSEDLLGSVSEVAERINGLLDDDNQKMVKRTLAGLEQTTRKAALLAERIEPAVQELPALVTDARGAVSKAEQLMARLEERIEMLNRVVASVEEVGTAAHSVNEETVPRLNALVDQLNRETRALDRVLNTLGEHPQSVVFGAPRGKPGPGEPGFAAEGR